mmetsp:Transcript_68907/g.156181  ORF Transcript_68907/g.156181 Transcript_68907/m.156181 type:complete len:229 (-) Transcript_68907:163-849(-)
MRGLLLDKIEGCLDTVLPLPAALLHDLRGVILVGAVHGGEHHLCEGAARQDEERQPEEEEEAAVDEGGDDDVRQDGRRHGGKGRVQGVAEGFEARVDWIAVPVDLGEIVEDHGRDPGEDHHRAQQERPHLADRDQHLPEGVEQGLHPGQRCRKAEPHVGRYPEGRCRVDPEEGGVEEAQDDHDVVQDDHVRLPEGAADLVEGPLQLRKHRHPRQDRDHEDVLDHEPDT